MYLVVQLSLKVMIILTFLFKSSLGGRSVTEFKVLVPLLQMIFNAIIYIGIGSSNIFRHESSRFVEMSKSIIPCLLLCNVLIDVCHRKGIRSFSHI